MTHFEIALNFEIDERQTVLFEIERALFTKRYAISKKHFEILSIHSISMAYSIWEGFVHKAFRLYIDYINALNIQFKNLSHDITVFHLENKFKQLREYPVQYNKKIDFFKKLENFYTTTHHPIHPVIDTQSNVSFEVLNSILKALSLEPFPEYWSTYTHPNPNLKEIMSTFLRYRNSIAHGGDISSEEKITQFIYDKYRKLISDLMYEIQNKMNIGINNNSYLK